ncbi:MAG TPA: amidohydrolase [Trebonia sp.]|jgi:amidohydrolase|nr:amidohydrolase [Trebonia sp.]
MTEAEDSLAAGTPGGLHEAILAQVRGLAGRALDLSARLHSEPETAFQERQAAALLTEWLDKEGFAVARGVAGLETAFVGSYGDGGPRIAFLLEYDALPGLGHGCGHNLIAAGGLTAATALVRALPRGTPGSILVIGTPGEEGGGGKVVELEAGVFDGIDAALMFHPADRTIPWRRSLACTHFRIRFRGVAAHAAKNPEQGQNALAAVIQFFVATDALRQHIGDGARMHGVITNGGTAPNVVPDLTEAEFLVRHPSTDGVVALAARVADCARAAALATGTAVEITEPTPLYEERNNNHTIASRMARYLAAVGVEVSEPSPDDPAGSSDIGNVSQRLPCIHPYIRIAPLGTPGHSVAMREAAATPAAGQMMLKAAGALARTGADLLTDPGFLRLAADEFTKSVTQARTA